MPCTSKTLVVEILNIPSVYHRTTASQMYESSDCRGNEAPLGVATLPAVWESIEDELRLVEVFFLRLGALCKALGDTACGSEGAMVERFPWVNLVNPNPKPQ